MKKRVGVLAPCSAARPRNRARATWRYIGFGADASALPYGDNAKAFRSLIEVGMKPAQCVVAACSPG